MADRKISDLTALTAPAAGDFLPVVDISEVSAASKNKRITIEELLRGAPDGIASAPSIAFESDPNTGIFSPGTDQLSISTGGTQRGAFSDTGLAVTGAISATSAAATAPLIATIGSTEAFRVHSTGAVGIGISSPSEILHISASTPVLRIDAANNAANSTLQFLGRNSNGSQQSKAQIIHSVTETGSGIGATLNFLTTKESASGGTFTSSMFIDKLGNVGIGTTSPEAKLQVGGGHAKFSTNGTYNGTDTHNFYQSNTSSFGLLVGGYGAYTSTVLAVQGTNSTATAFNQFEGYYGGDTSTGNGASVAIRIRGDGNITNLNNSYGALSDIKLKENVVDADSQWDDLKALQVRNYNFKEGQTHRQIGLVAQEVELVSPGLVSESPDRDEDGNDLGTVIKSVNYSVLYMKAVKALQEAMERIETLEQRLTDAGIA